MELIINGKGFGKTKTRGKLLFTHDPISFWGGVDPKTGTITDPYHELQGVSMAGKILAYPFNKGSSGTGLVILEMARAGIAPKGIICQKTELVMLAGPLISDFLYKKKIPVFEVNSKDFERLHGCKVLSMDCFKNIIIAE